MMQGRQIHIPTLQCSGLTGALSVGWPQSIPAPGLLPLPPLVLPRFTVRYSSKSCSPRQITKGKGLGQRTPSPPLTSKAIVVIPIIIWELLMEARGWRFCHYGLNGERGSAAPTLGLPQPHSGRDAGGCRAWAGAACSGDGTDSGRIQAAAVRRGKAHFSFRTQPELLQVSPALRQSCKAAV